MDDIENAVDMMLPADDAQENGQEITLEELMDNITDDLQSDAEETAEQIEGDGDLGTQAHAEEKTGEKDKFSRRISAALQSQRRGFQKDLDYASMVRGAAGSMTDDEIAEALRDYQARKIAESDTDISPKAARRIVEAQEKARSTGIDAQEQTRNLNLELKGLMDDGWTLDELKAMSQDEQVKAEINNGTSVRRAATAFLKRQSAATTAERKRHSIPTARSAGAGGVPYTNAYDRMSDEEFDRIAEKVRRATLSGKSVRL